MIGYAVVLLLLTRPCSSSAATTIILSLLNVVLIIVPLVALHFGALYYYLAREFVDCCWRSRSDGERCSRACGEVSRWR